MKHFAIVHEPQENGRIITQFNATHVVQAIRAARHLGYKPKAALIIDTQYKNEGPVPISKVPLYMED